VTPVTDTETPCLFGDRDAGDVQMINPGHMSLTLVNGADP